MENRYGVKLSEVKTFNKKYHDNHNKNWTTKELVYILESDKPLVELSIELGRSTNAICQKRKEMKLLEQRKNIEKFEIMP